MYIGYVMVFNFIGDVAEEIFLSGDLDQSNVEVVPNFTYSNYNDMKDAYSIWLCLGEKENTLNYLHLSDKKVIGSKNWRGNLNLLNAVIIGLSDELPEYDETYDLHRFLGVLLSNRLDYREKIEVMEKEYELELSEEWKEEIQTMYSFAAEIRKQAEREGWEKGETEGRAEGRAEGETRMGKLSELLVRLDRTKDIIKAVQDTTYRQKLYEEFDL